MQKKNVQKDALYYSKKLWKIYFYTLGGVLIFFLFASWGLFGKMPAFEELENPDSNIATEIIASDGVTIIGKYAIENRTPISYDDLPKHLVDALVSTEDVRFYDHSGIDFRRTTTAMLSLGTRGGASTITQQLAKNLFHGSEGSRNIVLRIVQKAKEWIIAVKLERQYTKTEIIAHYLNTVDFVSNAYGIRSAAKVYFNKEPRDLTVEEGAVLIGMLQAPSKYNPRFHPERAAKRRNIVMSQMVKNGKLSAKEYEAKSAKPIALNYSPENHKEGMATYFREYLREYLKKWVKDNPKSDGSEYDIYKEGLKIYTTIDARIQQYAEEAMEEHLPNLQQEFNSQQKTNKNAPFVNISKAETDKLMDRAMRNSDRWRMMSNEGKSEEEIIKSFDVKTKMTVFTWKGEKDTTMTPRDSIRYFKRFLQTGVMAMEPQTGHIKAWVGGINYKYFQYDHVGQGARQVGSTFKPFVYATAIEQLNMSPCDSIIDAPFTIPKGRHNVTETWTPNNSDHQYRGMVTLKRALALSINTVSAKLIDKVGPDAVIELTNKLGVQSKIPSQPSIALGAVEITVHDMVAAYSTFANQGVYVKPQFLLRIEDRNGAVLYESVPESHDVLNKDIAFAVIKLLQGVTESGSGARLRTQGGGHGYNRVTGYPYVFTNPIAGKTGTSQNQSDGWFVGMVPNLATGVWVGCEDRSARFKGITYGQGATAALPIWALMMRKCYADETLNISKADFERPANLSIKVDCWAPPVAVKDSTEIEQSTDEFEL